MPEQSSSTLSLRWGLRGSCAGGPERTTDRTPRDDDGVDGVSEYRDETRDNIEWHRQGGQAPNSGAVRKVGLVPSPT